MEIIVRFKGSEFNENLFQELKRLLAKRGDFEITLAISNQSTEGTGQAESKAEYFTGLDAAIERLNTGKGISFSADELKDWSNQLLNEP